MKTNTPWLNWWKAGVAAVMALASPALAQTPPPDYGFDFVTIGAVGNAAYWNPPSNPWDFNIAHTRGRVDYEYRIARLELTTGQWVEFLNAYSGYAEPNPYFDRFYGAGRFGAVPDFNFPGPGRRWRLTSQLDAAMFPVSGLSWRMCAMYCNWLHNGKGSDLASLITGAYDTSTWGIWPGSNGRGFTDAPTHLPGAKYWIPTLDEYQKAVYYDPNRYGPGQGGWWTNVNMSDLPAISGPPGVGTTSAGYNPDPNDPFSGGDTPLGAYPYAQSPWGLLDTSGGAQEFTEEIWRAPYPTDRLYSGAYAGIDSPFIYDTIEGYGGDNPIYNSGYAGLRIVSSIPSAPSSVVIMSFVCMLSRRRHHA